MTRDPLQGQSDRERNIITVVHRLDPNLLYRIDYLLMLYAKSLGSENVDTTKLDAALAKLGKETTELDETVKANQTEAP